MAYYQQQPVQVAAPSQCAPLIHQTPQKQQVDWDDNHFDCDDCIYNLCCPCLAVNNISSSSKYPVLANAGTHALIVFLCWYFCVAWSGTILITFALLWWKNEIGRELNIRRPSSTACMDHITFMDIVVILIGCFPCWISSVKRTVERNNEAGRMAEMMQNRNYNRIQPVFVMQQPQMPPPPTQVHVTVGR